MSAAQRYRTEIDGLRALAVMPVVLFHAGINGISGGFVGVDIFFVISGYLITGILYRDTIAGRYSIISFYERRVRRIFPALFTMLGITFVAGWFILLPEEMVGLGRQIVATTLFLSNMLFWRESGYFDSASETLPLLHTWSLSVEEQFYIFFPVAFSWVSRKRRDLVVVFISTIGVISFASSVILLRHQPEATFYSLPTRAWELAIGSIIAMAPAYTGRFKEALAICGVAAILSAIIFYSPDIPFPGTAALLPCIGAALILYACEGTFTAKILSVAPMRWIGLISYSLYLWHWPVLVYCAFLFGRPLTLPIAIGAIGLSILLAAASWWLVERPVRLRASVRTIWIIGGGCIAASLLGAFAIIGANGFPARYSSRSNLIMRNAEIEKDKLEKGYKCPVVKFDQLSNFGPCVIGPPSQRPTVIVIGDSHAMAMRSAFDRTLKTMGVPGTLISVAGCSPVAMDRVEGGFDCQKRSARIRRHIDEVRPKAVILVASWRGVLFTKNTIDKGRRSFDNASRLANVKSALSDTVKHYQQRGIKVAVLLPVPGALADVPSALARGSGTPLAWNTQNFRAEMNPFYAAVFSAHPNVIEDLSAPFCKTGQCMVSAERPLYMDSNHINETGAELIQPVLQRTVAKLIDYKEFQATARPEAKPVEARRGAELHR